MRKLLLALLAICVTMSVSAQGEYISNSRHDIADCFEDLEGKGGIMLLSKKNDLVITISDKDAEVRPAKLTSDTRYAYEIVVNRRNDVKVEVSHRGEVFSTEFVVGKKYLKENVFLAYLIEDVERPIQQNEQSKQTKVVFDQALSAVEIISSIEDLQVNCPELLAKGARLNVDNKIREKGIIVMTLTIPLNIISSAKAELAKLEEERDNLNKILLDPNTPQKEKTEDRWNRVDWLNNTGIVEQESLIENLTHITVYGKGTNRIDIDIDRDGKLAPRKIQSYAILLMKTIEKVHVSECAGFMDEGGRLFNSRDYANARLAFEKALNAKDTPPKLIPSIKTSISQCDTCIAYERYAISAMMKMNEMRAQGHGAQEKVFRYASGAADYVDVLYRYNACEFYRNRLERLKAIIKEIPLTIKFTTVSWVNDYSGFHEDAPLPNVEIWAYFDTPIPNANEYRDEKKFNKMITTSAYSLVGTTDEHGIAEINLDRNKLPMGIFFRPVGYKKKIKTVYYDTNYIMHRSKGDYDKKQFRTKMYVEQ